MAPAFIPAGGFLDFAPQQSVLQVEDGPLAKAPSIRPWRLGRRQKGGKGEDITHQESITNILFVSLPYPALRAEPVKFSV